MNVVDDKAILSFDWLGIILQINQLGFTQASFFYLNTFLKFMLQKSEPDFIEILR